MVVAGVVVTGVVVAGVVVTGVVVTGVTGVVVELERSDADIRNREG